MRRKILVAVAVGMALTFGVTACDSEPKETPAKNREFVQILHKEAKITTTMSDEDLISIVDSFIAAYDPFEDDRSEDQIIRDETFDDCPEDVSSFNDYGCGIDKKEAHQIIQVYNLVYK